MFVCCCNKCAVVTQHAFNCGGGGGAPFLRFGYINEHASAAACSLYVRGEQFNIYKNGHMYRIYPT